MIALSAYKLANYLADVVQFSGETGSEDVNWENIYGLAFGEINETSRNKCYFCFDEPNDKLNFFFKQSRSLSEANLRDIRSEAEFYALTARAFKGSVGEHLPKLVYYDDYNSVIVTEYVPLAKPIGESGTFATFNMAGKVLKQFHEVCKRDSVAAVWGDKKKWIDEFRFYEPKILRLTDSEERKLSLNDDVYVVQFLSFLGHHSSQVKELRQRWKSEMNGLIHGDADVRNFIQKGNDIVILDFECVAYGAWFWDVAVFIASLLLKTDLPGVPAETVRASPFDIFPCIISFLRGYGIESAEMRQEILKWSGIYLLQEFLLRQEEAIFFKYGLTLVDDTERCYQEIFALKYERRL
ncbi:phosphotransferase [Dyadobacter frigoris]|uniref:Aminoglycoside phosphotransferase domain-containing protein n=1 Tax=Dyadobacter frigoris TaxID=2576211 RepID=A0A4U6D5M8_9BACT|nr:phosphotransferase [Dyadobacter frigoris]TKT92670.1 hypothetical protein FDK13_07600 [Dyadobacter frigoris]